jgi:hypothetical protein
VHVDSATHSLSDGFHEWSGREKQKYIDQDPG